MASNSEYQNPGSKSSTSHIVDGSKLIHYQVLGLHYGATDKEILKAYKKQARRFHPDKTGSNSTEKYMKRLNVAKDVLLSEKRYDGQAYFEPAGYLPPPESYVKMMKMERDKEQALRERDEAQVRERKALEVAEMERKRAQQLFEETETLRRVMKRMEETQQSAEMERQRVWREIELVQRREREAREVAQREREVAEMEREQTQLRAEEAEAEIEELKMQWVVRRNEIQFTKVELGRGGWGAVVIANFREIQVAAKCLYKDLASSYYRDMFSREMNMAARLRHPNLVQFIGASIEGHPIILTELMKTSLRAELENENIKRHHIKSLSLDVARALNYLHLMQPQPIIHRDISSANVLLDPLPDSQWKAKITDYGSVNLQHRLHTVGPGSPVYSAPEVNTPVLQSSKMDIFSFGVLLVEMLTSRFPEVSSRQRLIASIDHVGYQRLIRQCLSKERDQRPSAQQLISTLHDI